MRLYIGFGDGSGGFAPYKSGTEVLIGSLRVVVVVVIVVI